MSAAANASVSSPFTGDNIYSHFVAASKEAGFTSQAAAIGAYNDLPFTAVIEQLEQQAKAAAAMDPRWAGDLANFEASKSDLLALASKYGSTGAVMTGLGGHLPTTFCAANVDSGLKSAETATSSPATLGLVGGQASASSANEPSNPSDVVNLICSNIDTWRVLRATGLRIGGMGCVCGHLQVAGTGAAYAYSRHPAALAGVALSAAQTAVSCSAAAVSAVLSVYGGYPDRACRQAKYGPPKTDPNTPPSADQCPGGTGQTAPVEDDCAGNPKICASSSWFPNLGG